MKNKKSKKGFENNPQNINLDGRPSKYNSKILTEVKEYLETTGREQTHLPKIESLALHLGVTRKTLYNWAKKHKKFAKALEIIITKQAEQLIDDGIYGGKEVNSTIVKLLLMNNHGMRERKDLTTDDEAIDLFSDEQIEKIARRRITRGRGSSDTSSKKKSN